MASFSEMTMLEKVSVIVFLTLALSILALSFFYYNPEGTVEQRRLPLVFIFLVCTVLMLVLYVCDSNP